MAQKSQIEWTESTWNPVTGCTKHSEGCANCYAERMANRLQAMGQQKYKDGFKLTLHPETLEDPLSMKKPQVIFVCSMSDIFHDDVPDEYIEQMFDVMNRAHWHIFQVLTKRAERLRDIADRLKWTPNIWIGVTVESDTYKSRVSCLRDIPAAVRFLSVEPMIGPVKDIDLQHIDWVIVGGESGPGARMINREWVIDVRDQCHEYGVKFFFKQWGGVNKKRAGRELDGRTYDAMPDMSLAQGRKGNSLFSA